MTNPEQQRLARLLASAPRRGWAQTRASASSATPGSMSRRRFLGTAGVGVGALIVGPSLLAACGCDGGTESSSDTTFSPTTPSAS